MPKAVNHVIFDGSPLIDLRSDTVTDPSHIMAGHVGHLADGTVVTGTGQGGGSVTWETKSDQGITITSDGTYNYATWTYTEPLQADETYRITWGENGTQYICETAVAPSGTYDGYYLGNASIANAGENTGEPFVLYRNNSTHMVVTTTQATGSWRVKIERQQSGANQDYENALVALGVQSDLADSIVALTTYANGVTGESDTTLSDAVHTLGIRYGGVPFYSGTYTPAEDTKGPSFNIGGSDFTHFFILPASDPRSGLGKKCFLLAYTTFGSVDEITISTNNTGGGLIGGMYSYKWFAKSGSTVTCTNTGTVNSMNAGWWAAGVTYNWFAW